MGIDKIKCVHVNDSKNILSSHKDRHENIGFGTIGFDTLLNIINNPRLEKVPKILETPYVMDKAPYKYEIEMIRNKKFNNIYSKCTLIFSGFFGILISEDCLYFQTYCPKIKA